ncbi:hypothetical protein EGT07_08005 [Herbaspirillum sp. HC18]|nr:hypothetical protein EGT07_08005 [Herbaspirillum sp. HC18]
MTSVLNKISNHGTKTVAVDVRGVKVGLRLLSGDEYLSALKSATEEVAVLLRNSGQDITLELVLREAMIQVIARAAYDNENSDPVFSTAQQVRGDIVRSDRNKLIDSYKTLEEQFLASQRL